MSNLKLLDSFGNFTHHLPRQILEPQHVIKINRDILFSADYCRQMRYLTPNVTPPEILLN